MPAQIVALLTLECPIAAILAAPMARLRCRSEEVEKHGADIWRKVRAYNRHRLLASNESEP